MMYKLYGMGAYEMKIDLHCHTKSTKKGDGNGRKVTRDLFCEKVADADVKILAITNHNHFDIEQYYEFRNAVKDYCMVWPGVEIDIQGKTKWHLIVVSNPDNVELFASGVDSLFAGKNLDKCALTMEEVYSVLNHCDVIYIPHYHKNPGIKEEDRKKLEEMVGDESRIFLELSNHRSLGVYTNYGYRSIVGSDVRDWAIYDKSEFAELKLPVESFHQFCLLAKRDKDIVETLLNKKQWITLTAKPHNSVSFPLKVYQDVNVLFGPKGTGKTEIIKSLYEDLISHGVSCEKYIASEKGEDFKSILSNAAMERDISKVGADSCEDDFLTISTWKEIAPTPFKQYVTWFQTKEASANKRKMRITEASTLQYYKPEKYDSHKSDRVLADEIIDRLKKIRLEEYLDIDDVNNLNILIRRLLEETKSKREADLIDEYSTSLVNLTIMLIKKHADRSTDTVSKPSTTGFIGFAQNRLKLFHALSHILSTLQRPEKREFAVLGTLEGKGKVYVTSRYRFLCDESYASEFDKRNGYRNLQNIVHLLKETREQIYSNDLASKVQELNTQLKEHSVSSIKPFLGVEKYISDVEGNPYSPSNGEESIILLQRTLNREAEAYILDEPELGMGNSYIDSTIRPLIINLAKQRKYVIVATHNANIAVRTLPYMSVFRTHEKGVYATYCGNPFNDLLVNIEDSNDIKSWSVESLHTLEGGTEAFYERKDIYESKNN